MGWEALEQWGDDVARVEPLTGGIANEVWSVQVNGQLAVGRLGDRSDADLAWETELIRHLDREGLTVPVPIPTKDGRYFVDGVMVMTYVEGGPPETDLVLPHNAAGLDDDAHDIASQASAAWEAAVCWEDEYAMMRLAQVRPVAGTTGIESR